MNISKLFLGKQKPNKLRSEIKQEALQLLSEGWSVSDVARDVGVSRSTVTEWNKERRGEGDASNYLQKMAKDMKNFAEINSAMQRVFGVNTVVQNVNSSLELLGTLRDTFGTGDDEDTAEKMLLQVIMQKLSQPNGHANQNQPSHQPSITEQPALTDNKNDVNAGIHNFNKILNAISSLPDKTFTKKTVGTIIKKYGIDETALKQTIKKLVKVYE